jgi:hypothetical protein
MSHLSALAASAAVGLLALPGSLPAAMAETVVVHDGAGHAPPAMT